MFEVRNILWWEGPKWLCNRAKDWPSVELHTDGEEVKKARRKNAEISTLNNELERFYCFFLKIDKYCQNDSLDVSFLLQLFT